MTAYHPRVSVNSICSWGLPFQGDLELWADVGIDHVGLIEPKLDAFGWEASPAAVRDAGLRVSSISCFRSGTARSLELCTKVGAKVLYLSTGGYGPIPWEEAATAFGAEMQPLAGRAAELGVKLAVEPTNPLRADHSFVHSLRDALDLARRCGMSVVVDLYSTWYERGLEALLGANPDLLALVQVCDYTLGTTDMPNRSVVGDGDIPIGRILAATLEAGYTGPFDIEILGPRVEAEGYRSAIARSAERTSELLDHLGA